MTFKEKLLYTFIGAGISLSAIIIILMTAAFTRTFDAGYRFYGDITCESLKIVDKEGDTGISLLMDELGGKIMINSKHDPERGIILRTLPKYGQIWLGGSIDADEWTTIDGNGTLVLNTKDATMSIDSKKLHLSDEKGDTTLKLPEENP